MMLVYMARCADGSLYTGVTGDLQRRLAQHNGAKPGGARYTRTRRPVTLAYVEEVESLGDALRREAEIKRMTRANKERLAARWRNDG